ncbi:flagellar assembly protein FliH [Psychromonas sp. SA13A]|uniref:flagellar assembly protein FliH n=1 Tax=Psychromonas sp. SA13A TaxID=2686346 RepID=UPI00140BA5BB|nr:flagellar assembly protein FliH [Psychromonas sp. SA13A]
MSIESDKDFQEWILPDFEAEETLQEDEIDLFGRPANWYRSQQEEEPTPVKDEPKPLTLEDIESIRASAYEDGFNEGKEAGMAKGLEEGKLQGLAEGHEQGLAQGIEQGLSEGKAKVDAQALHWEQLVSRLHQPLEKLDDNVEFQLIKLATNLAEQMARCEVSVNPQVILQALKQGVEALPVNEQTIVISLNPEDLVFVETAFSESECQKRGWDLRSEPTLLRGDCQIHTQISSIDYAFSTRIEQVLKHFLKENYENTPEVSNDGDISHDQPLDYEMKTEQDLLAEAESSTEPTDINDTNAINDQQNDLAAATGTDKSSSETDTNIENANTNNKTLN